MSEPKLIIVLGETTAKPQQLLEEGVALNGTGLTVTLEIKKYAGGEYTAVSPAPAVAWLTQASGIVEITGVENLAVGNYYVRYKLTNGAGKYDYVPNGKGGDLWKVVGVAVAEQ